MPRRQKPKAKSGKQNKKAKTAAKKSSDTKTNNNNTTTTSTPNTADTTNSATSATAAAAAAAETNGTTTTSAPAAGAGATTASNGSTANGAAKVSNGANGSDEQKEASQKDKEKEKEKEKEKDLASLIMKRNPRRWKVDKDQSHAFWDGQPVPNMNDRIDEEINEAIENKKLDDVRKEPLKLPPNFEWCDMDLNDDTELTEFYNLLYNHYVEDDDNMFRFNYSKDFLKWALLVPGYLQQWHLGVRHNPKRNQDRPETKQDDANNDNNNNNMSQRKRGRLCAAITAIPALVNIKKKQVKMVEINFLCVFKSLRSKRLAPVLIKEITRRVNCQDVWQAVYTAGVVIPKPVASNRYWHRSLNPKKLIDIGFSCMRQRMTMPRLLRLYRVDSDTKCKGLRAMKESDVSQCYKLLNKYLKNFEMTIEFNEEEVKHLLLPRKDVIYTYVVAEKAEKEGEEEVITDFFSYYNLSSTVINNPKYNNMKAAYSYYNVTTKTPLKDLMSDALVLAKKQGFDVFNALDVMENSTFLKDLKFGIGDGRLQYYMYNWRCSELKPGDVGIVLL